MMLGMWEHLFYYLLWWVFARNPLASKLAVLVPSSTNIGSRCWSLSFTTLNRYRLEVSSSPTFGCYTLRPLFKPCHDGPCPPCEWYLIIWISAHISYNTLCTMTIDVITLVIDPHNYICIEHTRNAMHKYCRNTFAIQLIEYKSTNRTSTTTILILLCLCFYNSIKGIIYVLDIDYVDK